MGLSPNVEERTLLLLTSTLSSISEEPWCPLRSPLHTTSFCICRAEAVAPAQRRAAEGVGVPGDSSIVIGLCEDRQGRMSPSGRKLREHGCKCRGVPPQPGLVLQEECNSWKPGLSSSINLPHVIIKAWLDFVIIFWNTLRVHAGRTSCLTSDSQGQKRLQLEIPVKLLPPSESTCGGNLELFLLSVAS